MSRSSPPARELDDLSLALARRGDDQACRRLVEAYERPVFALLSRMLVRAGQGALIDDLAQETFLRVFGALRDFRSEGPARLSTWILTIATRVALDELARRRPVLASVEEAEQLAVEPIADRLDRERVRRAILSALEQLPVEQRAVFVLREHHELGYDEIARGLEIDLNTVKSRLFRARSALREALREVHDG